MQLMALKAKFPAKRTAKFGADPKRTIEFETPPTDTWSFYKGMVQTTTVEALPKTLSLIESRTKQDADTFSKRVGDLRHEPRNSEQAQARSSLSWLDQDLKTYLAQLHGLTVAR